MGHNQRSGSCLSAIREEPGMRGEYKESPMLSRCVGAAIVLCVLGGFVIAETYQGVITSLSDKEVKFTIFKKKEKGEEKTFKIAKDAKITLKAKSKDDEDKTLKLDEATKHVEKAAAKSKGEVKGARATIKTEGSGDDEKVTAITFGGRGKKGKEE
jgi:hypothetical protein